MGARAALGSADRRQLLASANLLEGDLLRAAIAVLLHRSRRPRRGTAAAGEVACWQPCGGVVLACRTQAAGAAGSAPRGPRGPARGEAAEPAAQYGSQGRSSQKGWFSMAAGAGQLLVHGKVSASWLRVPPRGGVSSSSRRASRAPRETPTIKQFKPSSLAGTHQQRFHLPAPLSRSHLHTSPLLLHTLKKYQPHQGGCERTRPSQQRRAPRSSCTRARPRSAGRTSQQTFVSAIGSVHALTLPPHARAGDVAAARVAVQALHPGLQVRPGGGRIRR
jgi:hypothetical protein